MTGGKGVKVYEMMQVVYGDTNDTNDNVPDTYLTPPNSLTPEKYYYDNLLLHDLQNCQQVKR